MIGEGNAGRFDVLERMSMTCDRREMRNGKSAPFDTLESKAKKTNAALRAVLKKLGV
jgi:hypothetical protein